MEVAASLPAQPGESAVTPQQIELVQTSFKKVVPIAGTAADLFYDRLFEIAPEVRSMFPQDLTEQKKKLMGMLGTAVGSLHKLETILPAVQDLGKRHKGYGVTAAHYAPVGAALLWTLEKGLGEAWTPETAAAWTKRPLALVAGLAGPTRQAVAEAEIARGIGYHAGLLSLAAMKAACPSTSPLENLAR